MQKRWMVFAMVGVIAGLGGRSVEAADLEPLVVEGTVHAPIDAVWDAFYDEDKRKWMTPECSVNMTVGGLIRSSYIPGADLDGEHAIHHKIIAFEPGRRMISELTRGPKGFPHTGAMLGSLGIFELDPIGPNATRIRSVITGLRDDEAGKAAYGYFKEGNAFTFDGVKAHLEHPDQAERTELAMELLGTLAGGEWIHEGAMPDGNAFLVRNVVRKGPDGKSLISNGWLGFGDAGMFDHGPTIVWLDPDGVIRFNGVHETGATGSGTIRLISDDTVEWDWNEHTQSGEHHRYAIGMTIPGGDEYTAKMESVADNGERTMFVDNLEYKRVDVAPERFRTLTTGQVIAASGQTILEQTEMHATTSKARLIEVTAVIPASVEEVWRSWTTSEGMTAFIGAESEIDLSLGGKFEIYFDDSAPAGSRGSETCKVLGFLPERMLSFTWNAPPHFKNARFIHTWVDVGFKPISAEQTEVTLTHAGWDENRAAHPELAEEWDGAFAYFENAWPRVMEALKAHHETN